MDRTEFPVALALLLLATLIPRPSAGQASTANPQPSASQAAPEPTAEKGVIDVLIVDHRSSYESDVATSSTRTPTPLQQTPQSVSVVTRKTIDDQQVNSVADAVTNVSGVVPTNPLLTPSFDSTLIRGFPAEQMIDGFTQYYSPGDRQSLVNVERIEVLKGPNGVLYGGGAGSTVGGLVNLISKSPTGTPMRTIGIRVGSDDLLQPFFDVNQPLGDHVRFRATGEYTSSGSDIDVVDTQRFNVNPALTFTDGAATTLTLRGTVSRWRQPDYQGLPATGTVASSDAPIDPALAEFVKVPAGNPNPKVDRHLFVGNPDIPASSSQFDSIALHFEHVFSGSWRLELQSRYARSQFDEKAQLIAGSGLDFGADRPIIEPPALSEAFGLGALPFLLFNARLFQQQQEVSVIGNVIGERSWGPVRTTLLLGADYSRYDDSGFLAFLPVRGGFVVDLANPTFDQPFVVPGSGKSDNSVVDGIAGGYVQVQATVYDRLHLLGAARLGQVRIDYKGPDVRDVTDYVGCIPRVGAVFDLIGGFSLFAGYGSGVRGQPFTIFTESPRPEFAHQMEAGIKASIGDRWVGQVAYFEIQRSNVAVPDPNGGIGSVARGRQASHGIDAELIVHPIPSVSLLLAYAWTRASFEDDLYASFGSGVTALPGVPENSGRLWLNYDFGGWLRGLRIGAGVHAESGSQISVRNSFFSDTFFTADASIGYNAKRFSLGFRVANLTNEEYFVRLNYLGGRVAPGPSRSFQFTAALHF
jgi:iron complex outermembrane receptor protein